MSREIKFTAETILTDGYSRRQHYVYTVIPKREDHKGWYKENGYVMRLTKGHIHSNKRGYVPEHRLIIEEQLGRFLIPRKELVHHINGVRDDNRLDNLKLTNPKDHAKGHIGERNKNGSFVCKSKEFENKKFRLYDIDRNLTTIFTLSQLISKTFRRGKFEYRGEFSGLKDKNGKEIYEGDICKLIPNDEHIKDTHMYGIRKVIYDSSEAKYFYDPYISMSFGGFISVEIIGNIHENPELL